MDECAHTIKILHCLIQALVKWALHGYTETEEKGTGQRKDETVNIKIPALRNTRLDKRIFNNNWISDRINYLYEYH